MTGDGFGAFWVDYGDSFVLVAGGRWRDSGFGVGVFWVGCGDYVMTHEPTTNTWTWRMRYDPMKRIVAAWSTGTTAPSDVYAFAYDRAGERVLRYRMADGQVQEATYFLRDEAGNVLAELVWAPTSPGSSEGA
jgi:hypothetical protein